MGFAMLSEQFFMRIINTYLSSQFIVVKLFCIILTLTLLIGIMIFKNAPNHKFF